MLVPISVNQEKDFSDFVGGSTYKHHVYSYEMLDNKIQKPKYIK
jgi:hypothetical protein